MGDITFSDFVEALDAVTSLADDIGAVTNCQAIALDSDDTTITVDNNLYFIATGSSCSVGRLDATDYDTIAEWRAALSSLPWVGRDINSVEADPLFISTSDFHLQSTSPCIGAGTFVQGVHDQIGVTDYDGVPFNSMFPYIGAYDYPQSPRPTLQGGFPG